MDHSTLMIIIIVAGVLVASGLFMFAIKKIGLSLVNVSLTILKAIEGALNDGGMAKNKFSVVLDLVVQALSYVQAICSTDVTMKTKVTKALEYIKNISTQFDIYITDNDVTIISTVLQLGFRLMDAFGVNSKANCVKLYSYTNKHIDTEADIKDSLKMVGMYHIKEAL